MIKYPQMEKSLKVKIYKNLEKLKTIINKNLKNFIFISFLFINFLILFIDFLIIPPLRLGEISPRNIEAPRTIVYIDNEETERLKNLLLSQFKPIYKIDQNITLEVIQKVEEIFKNQEGVSNGVKKYLISLSSSKLENLIKRTEVWISDIYSQGITPENIEKRKQEFRNFLRREFDFPNYVSEELSQILIKTNMYIDEKETEVKKQELLKTIKPVEKLISKGEIIVRRGEVIDEKKYRILDAFGYTTSLRNILKIIGILGFVFLSLLFQRFFFFKILSKKDDFSSFTLSQVLFSLGLLLIKLFSILIPLITPLSSIFILSICFLDISYFLLIGFQLSLFIGIINNSFLLLIISLVNLLAVLYYLRDIEDRSSFIKTGFYLSFLNIIAFSFYHLFSGETPKQISEILSIIANPLLSIILSLGLLPFLENLFRVATPLRLLELSNPNYPLLHKLFLEAPGTYYHSLIVGNLAERAAEAVKANIYLIRTASLYHDIGKIKRPQYFIENLMPGQTNPHNFLSPYISVLIIRNHTKDGTQIANSYKFPKAIIDIIEQHHGTSIITYFYHKQKDISSNPINIDDFRYPGPKPKSKEAVIVMLADSVEAATRSLVNPTPESVEKIVRKIIRERLEDGQLEDANLTLEELEKISQSFIKTLIRMRHPRIPYPEEIKK